MKKFLVTAICFLTLAGCTSTVRGSEYKVTLYTPSGNEVYYCSDYTAQDNNTVILNVNGRHIGYNGYYKVEIVK